MKKLLMLGIALFGFSTVMVAQDISENAIGLRLGDSDGFGAEVSYQRALGSNNRLELDLGLRSGKHYDGFKLAGIYQWVWSLMATLTGMPVPEVVLALTVGTMYLPGLTIARRSSL